MINHKAINSILSLNTYKDLLMFPTFRHDGEASYYTEAGYDHYVHAYNCSVNGAFLISIFFKDEYSLLDEDLNEYTAYFSTNLLLNFKKNKLIQEGTIEFFDREGYSWSAEVSFKKVKHFKDFTECLQYFKHYFSKKGFRKDLLKPRNLYTIFESTLTQEQKAA